MDATPIEHACAGTSASVVAMALLYPLDTIRVRLQVERSDLGHRTPLQVLREAAESPEGIASLYKGLQSTLFTVSVSQAIYFFWYNYLKQAIQGRQGKPMSTGTALGVAYAAGAINATLTCPLWTVSTRLKLAAKARAGSDEEGVDTAGSESDSKAEEEGVEDYSGSTLAIMLRIAKREGPAALFHGVPSALMLCTNPAIQFLVYERLKSRLLATAKHITAAHSFVYGALAKAVATFVTYPLQVVQARANANTHGGDSSTFAIAKRIFENEGIAGFFKGIQSKLLQTVLNSAFIFLIYEKLLLAVTYLLRLRRRVRKQA